VKTCLKYHGGKAFLANRIVELMPPHTRYCEPYFGGGAVLFARDGEGVAEFVNDLNRGLWNFWNVLRDEDMYRQFIRYIQACPFSQDEFGYSSAFPDGPREIVNAATFFIRNRQSRQGLGKSFATPTSRLRRGMNENVSAWLTAVDGLPEFHARLRRVEIRNQDAVKFIAELDSQDTCWFLDPPYVHETRTVTDSYEHEMTAEQHQTLLDRLGTIKGKFILSGYPSEMYAAAEAKYGWRHIDVHIDNKASSAKTKEVKIERLWMNY
jgi:DNA adenine methylase